LARRAEKAAPSGPVFREPLPGMTARSVEAHAVAVALGGDADSRSWEIARAVFKSSNVNRGPHATGARN